MKKKFEFSPADKQILFAADRAIHLQEVILPALARGNYVVCDRYILSSIAYGGSEDIDLNWLMKINSKFIIPDITVLLQVASEICMERIKKNRKETEYFEDERKLKRVWNYYKVGKLFFKNVHIINGEQPVEKVHEDIKKLIEKEV